MRPGWDDVTVDPWMIWERKDEVYVDVLMVGQPMHALGIG